jgi:hypothetical protein
VNWIHSAQAKPVVGCSEYDKEPSASTKDGEFLGQVSNRHLVKK